MDDYALAMRISDALATSGIHTTNQTWDAASGDTLAAQVRETIRASDVFVVLLSPAVAASRWVNTEIELALSTELERRGAEVIPVLAAPTDLPPSLRERAVVDLTTNPGAGLAKLVEQIQMT